MRKKLGYHREDSYIYGINKVKIFKINYMKVIVWVDKNEIKSMIENIQNVFTHCPQPGYGNYIQVSMSIDEYVKIQDNNKVKDK